MNTNNAEVKPVKLGETVTDNADGNPELSPQIGESVETRRRVCIECGNELFGYRNKKYCSTKCSNAYLYRKNWLKYSKAEKPGVGRGNNQWGTKNPMYKNGIGIFSKQAIAHYGKKCNRCGSLDNIVVHHRDHNRDNNLIENLEVLCKGCHQAHHCRRDAQTGQYIKG